MYIEIKYVKNGKNYDMTFEIGNELTSQLNNVNRAISLVLMGTNKVNEITARTYLKAEECGFMIGSGNSVTTKS